MASSLFIIHTHTSYDKEQERKCFLAKALHFYNSEFFLVSKFHYSFLHHFSNSRVPLKRRIRHLYPSIHNKWTKSLLEKGYSTLNQHVQIFSEIPRANCDLKHTMYFLGLQKKFGDRELTKLQICSYVTWNSQLIIRKCSTK